MKQSRVLSTWLLPVSVAISTGLYLYLTYFVARSDFWVLLFCFALLFGVYTLILAKYVFGQSPLSGHTLYLLLGAALLFRLVQWGAWPVLSDDFYRFYWDGKLLVQGYNPYLHLPRVLQEAKQAQNLGLSKLLFEQLNSPDYYTVYPPVNQLFFALAAGISPKSLWGGVIVMRTLILLAEVLSLFFLKQLLRRWNLPTQRVLIYAWNPLVILELTGNLHFEAVVICFFLVAIYCLEVFKQWTSLLLAALFYALAISTKLIPIIFLPFFLRKLGWQKAIILYVGIGIFTFLTFLPFLSQALLENIFSSINLYFQKFEFNASIYYLVRWVGWQIYGYNIILAAGPLLSILTLSAVLLLAFLRRPQGGADFLQGLLFGLSIYYFLATTVHPWYICTLVMLSVFSPYRYAILWSGLVILSYATYQDESYTENLYLVGLEYFCVFGYLVFEMVRSGFSRLKIN